MAKVRETISTPTDHYHESEQPRGNGFRHLMPHLRLGRMSAEEFARAKREAIPVDPDAGDALDTLIVTKAGKIEAQDVHIDMTIPEVSADNYTKKTKARKKKRKSDGREDGR